MSPSPSVSVIIPVYNVEKYLHECIDSVLAQSLQDFEIILVDDESPDNSGAICEDYARNDSRIKVIHKKNGGLGYARNSGLEQACGKYIFFLDSDDYLPSDALHSLLTEAEKHGADATHGLPDRFIKPGKFSGKASSGKVRLYTTPDELQKVALCIFGVADAGADIPYCIKGSAWGTLYRRSFIMEHGLRFVSERQYISEDYIFNYEVCLRARCVCQMEKTVYHYRVNPDSLTMTSKADTMQRIADYCRDIEKMCSRDGLATQGKRHAAAYLLSRVRAQYKYMFLSRNPFKEKMRWARQTRDMACFKEYAPVVATLNLSRLHRLSYSLFEARRMRTMYLLIKVQDMARRLRGTIV